MKRALLVAVVVAALALASLPAWAETYKVSDLAALEKLVADTLKPGDVAELQPGVYYLEVPRITVRTSGTPEAPVIIRGVLDGETRPCIDAGKVNVKRSIFVVAPDVHDVVFENLEMRNAWGSRFPDAPQKYGINASAVYFENCNNVTVRNCWSHHNEDGFFATHGADFILIENCDIGYNGTLTKEPHNGTHNFYFCARHQMVKNSYIHNSNEAQNWKSRGGNTIFAFNWVDEEYAYSLGADSDNAQNTLWLGNVVMKRTYGGIGQGRIGGLGDGTGVAQGTVVVLNNTFVTVKPRDFHLFTERSSTGDFYCLNNAFVGPGLIFLDHNGKGKVYGTNNWFAGEALNIPNTMENFIRNDDLFPKMVDAAKLDFRPAAGSELIDGGVSSEDYLKAVKMVTQYSRGEGQDIKPSPLWLKALEDVERPYPAFEPLVKAHGFQPRELKDKIDLGAYEYAGDAR